MGFIFSIVVMIAIIIFGGFVLAVFRFVGNSNLAQDLESENITVSLFLDGKYLGGIPVFTISEPEDMRIILDNEHGNMLIISNDEKERELIPYSNIKSVTQETKESLSATRILLVGLLAFALKSKTKYYKICYINDIGEEYNVVFESNFSEKYVQKILNNRYDYLKKHVASND